MYVLHSCLCLYLWLVLFTSYPFRNKNSFSVILILLDCHNYPGAPGARIISDNSDVTREKWVGVGYKTSISKANKEMILEGPALVIIKGYFEIKYGSSIMSQES